MGYIFSVKMKSKKHMKSISISNEVRDRVLFEGDLGELDGIAFIGSRMLEGEGIQRRPQNRSRRKIDAEDDEPDE